MRWSVLIQDSSVCQAYVGGCTCSANVNVNVNVNANVNAAKASLYEIGLIYSDRALFCSAEAYVKIGFSCGTQTHTSFT